MVIDEPLLAVYREFSTAALLDLRIAFILDRAAATRPETQAFCVGRLAVIDAVLHERANRERSDAVL